MRKRRLDTIEKSVQEAGNFLVPPNLNALQREGSRRTSFDLGTLQMISSEQRDIFTLLSRVNEEINEMRYEIRRDLSDIERRLAKSEEELEVLKDLIIYAAMNELKREEQNPEGAQHRGPVRPERAARPADPERAERPRGASFESESVRSSDVSLSTLSASNGNRRVCNTGNTASAADTTGLHNRHRGRQSQNQKPWKTSLAKRFGRMLKSKTIETGLQEGLEESDLSENPYYSVVAVPGKGLQQPENVSDSLRPTARTQTVSQSLHSNDECRLQAPLHVPLMNSQSPAADRTASLVPLPAARDARDARDAHDSLFTGTILTAPPVPPHTLRSSLLHSHNCSTDIQMAAFSANRETSSPSAATGIGSSTLKHFNSKV